jgi:hypothetical protein
VRNVACNNLIECNPQTERKCIQDRLLPLARQDECSDCILNLILNSFKLRSDSFPLNPLVVVGHFAHVFYDTLGNAFRTTPRALRRFRANHVFHQRRRNQLPPTALFNRQPQQQQKYRTINNATIHHLPSTIHHPPSTIHHVDK